MRFYAYSPFTRPSGGGREKKGSGMKNAKLYTYNGETKTLPEFAKQYGMNYSTLKDRMRLGWDLDRALHEPVHPKESRARGRVECPYPNCDDCPYPDCRW